VKITKQIGLYTAQPSNPGRFLLPRAELGALARNLTGLLVPQSFST